MIDRIRRLAHRCVHPARLRNWMALRGDRTTRPLVCRSLPIRIDVEPTTRCNLRCRTCQRFTGDWPERDLPTERFRRILDQLPHLEEMKLMGVGEPLLGENFFELVRIARRRSIRVWTITNGTTLGEKHCLLEILNSGLDELRVSIDSPDAETHARWRGGADLEAIADGLRELVHHRGRAPIPRLGIWCVGNVENLFQLPELVERVAALNVDDLYYVVHMSGWGKEDVFARTRKYSLASARNDLDRNLNQAAALAADRGVSFSTWNVDQCSAEKPCAWPWTSCFISAGGQVTRCAIASDPRLHHFGTIEDRPFAEIWNSQEYQEFRRSHREFDIPRICEPCYGLTGPMNSPVP